MVFYRKYRPQTLDEVIGQPQVKQTLQKAFLSQRLAHAYLFCGPKGTGKTSTARILAKMVNCEKPDASGSPCNLCTTCISITDGSNLDLIEIDAASNRGIDDIRDLREKIKLAPSSARKKVYIIDEAHMLTTEAFNALLKTLEEPPEHVLFIMATTEVHKIPQTILSRVQRLDFQPGKPDELLEALNRVAEKEKIDISKEALELLAKKSEGSFRDCQKLLEQLASNGEKITVITIEEHLKSGSFEEVALLLENLAAKDGQKALDLVQKQLDSGVNVKEFIMALIGNLRSMLLCKYNLGEKATGLDSKKYQTLNTLSQKFDINQITDILNSLVFALEKMKVSPIQSLPLEIAILENCTDKKQQFLEEAVSVKGASKEFEAKKEQPGEQVVDDVLDSITKPSADLNKITDKWNYILETIKPYNFSLEALLRQVKLLSLESDVLTLEAPYSFHQRMLEAPKSRNLLESVLSEVSGRPVRVICVLGKRPVRVEEIQNIEVAADDEIIRVAAEIFNS